MGMGRSVAKSGFRLTVRKNGVARFILPGGERYEIEFWQDRLEGRPVTCVVPHRAGSPGRLAWEDCNKGAGRVSRCHQLSPHASRGCS